jgi:predicted enzyme related to lactoylglutathione lyase
MDRTYPQGVTCWIDVSTADVAAATDFYGSLFGWTFEDVLPPDAPERYVIATLNGRDAGAVGSGDGVATWNTYIAVNDVDATAVAMVTDGADLRIGPQDAGPGGRLAELSDPGGAVFRLWQARRRLGVQVVNEPGAWNFSDLRLRQPADLNFYVQAFGWLTAPQEPWTTMIRVPGYGDHLEATVDPDIRVRQAAAPEGFEDVIGGAVLADADEPPHWHVTFTVADRDRETDLARRLGATVVRTAETPWTKTAELRDPQGAVFTISQFTPPSGW